MKNTMAEVGPVIASGVVLLLCLAAFVAVQFQPYDPAAPAGSETAFDQCLLAAMAILPIAAVRFAKSLFTGRRFRFLLSWMVGFLIVWAVILYEIFFPKIPPEGCYCSKMEECLLCAIPGVVIIAVICCLDSLVEWLLNALRDGVPWKSKDVLVRNWFPRFVAQLAGTILLSWLIVHIISR